VGHARGEGAHRRQAIGRARADGAAELGQAAEALGGVEDRARRGEERLAAAEERR
jgi:hypothetical protein